MQIVVSTMLLEVLCHSSPWKPITQVTSPIRSSNGTAGSFRYFGSYLCSTLVSFEERGTKGVEIIELSDLEITDLTTVENSNSP